MWPSRVRRRIISETFSCWSSTTRMRPGSELAPGSSSAAIVPREHRDHDGPELPNQTTCFHVSPESPAMVFESRSHFGVAANAPASSTFPAITRPLHPAENALACQERRSGGCSVWHTPAIRKSNGSAAGMSIACYPSSTSRIFRPRVSELNGLCRNAIPGLSTPCSAMASSAYPDM